MLGPQTVVGKNPNAQFVYQRLGKMWSHTKVTDQSIFIFRDKLSANCNGIPYLCYSLTVILTN